MSIILKMIQAFPLGRTTEELIILVGAGFSHDKRISTIAELEEHLRAGLIERGTDGKWRPRTGRASASYVEPEASIPAGASLETEYLFAASAQFATKADTPQPLDEIDASDKSITPAALLRYWRSALRADPRGATTQVADKHGIEWSLISARGPMVVGDGEVLSITLERDALSPQFLEAVIKREGNENGLAIGWPMAIGRRSGYPTFQPVGLFAARWERVEGNLVLAVDANDVLVNPDWIKDAARTSGWNRDALAELFDAADGAGLTAPDFLDRLRDAVARQIRGNLTGTDLASQLDINAQGIYDSAAIFLPTESSFTAGAARDLDQIAEWPIDRLARTSLAPVFGLNSATPPPDLPALNAVPLNGEQLRAVRFACTHPLTVVTGPPGTGKSQAIVSIAASVLIAGGSVLVASKNHQALDVVEDRLGGLAPDARFLVRTLNKANETDISFSDVAKTLIEEGNPGRNGAPDEMQLSHLREAGIRRAAVVDTHARKTELEFQIAETIERLAFRAAHLEQDTTTEASTIHERRSLISRFIAALKAILAGRSKKTAKGAPQGLELGASTESLSRLLEQLRTESAALDTSEDPVELGETIQALTKTLLPARMAQRTWVSEDAREALAESWDEWTFSGGRGALPTDIARGVIQHRPLWLASILGAPRRIPLDDELFDLVIFDEASQCDIATAIPLFARAKRAVVVGDDKQLTFIPQLGQAQDRNLMQAQGLPEKGISRFAQSRRSLFEFASRVPGVARVTLRHQYRSAGPIVDYISQAFYGGVLETSYDPDKLKVPKGTKPGIAWQDVISPAVPQSGNGNPAEVAAIVAHLRKLLIEQAYEGSVGVIAPFRVQVQALEQAIVAAIPAPAREAAELRVATVDGFQGQERDLILFSPCVGPRSPQTGLTFFQKDKRRLNVAISRARAVAMVFGDLGFARSGKLPALRKLAALATEPRARGRDGVFDSEWERRMAAALEKRGISFTPQYDIAGRRLDFALFGANGIKLDLEVDGRKWHETQDGQRKTSDLWRDHQLKSMGWKIRRFWVDELAKDMEGCLDLIQQDLS